MPRPFVDSCPHRRTGAGRRWTWPRWTDEERRWVRVRKPHHRARGSIVAGIFISYRRDDSEGEAGRLFETLAKRYGSPNVFMDVDSMTLGGDFRTIADFGISFLVGNSDDARVGLSNRGMLAFNLEFTDGTSGVFTAAIPIPEPTTSVLSLIPVALVAWKRAWPVSGPSRC